FHHLARERALVAALTDALKVRPEDLPERVASVVARLREAEKELAGLRQGRLLAAAGSLADGAVLSGSTRFVGHDAGPVASADDLRSLALDIRERLGEEPAV